MKNKKIYRSSQLAFTMIELIVVIAILVIIGSMIASILYSTLRGTSKTKITDAVAQNGNFAMSVMTDIIRSSTSVGTGGAICASTAPTPAQSIVLNRVDGGVTTLLCDPAGKTVASVSATLNVNLLDTSIVQVDTSSINNCNFTCTQANPYSPPLIGVYFVVTDKTGIGGLYENKSGNNSGTFRTSVSMLSFTQ